MKLKNYFYFAYYKKQLLFLILFTFVNTAFGFNKTKLPLNPKNETFNSTCLKSASTTEMFELHRFWLSLYQGTNSVGQTLIGYVTGATQGPDSGIDALYFNDSPLALTSLINNNEYIIQGRSLPFQDTDVVPLGFKTDALGTFTIALSNFDGLFLANQAIFLKDKLTGTLQNLKTASYTFTSQVGVFNNRFEIWYRNDSTTFENGSWNNGIPTINLNAVIAENFISTSDLTAKSLIIKPECVFTVASGTTLSVENTITNESGVENFIIENNAALLQNSNLSNAVLATVKRNSHPLYRQDYSLWSSPVFEPNLRNFSPATLFNRFYSYNFETAYNGAYKQELFTNADVLNKKFELAKGYLIRMPNNWIAFNAGAAVSYPGIFKGILNNGLISTPLYGAVPMESNGLNLVGNPYPSPISISAFFAANSSIETTLYFWRKQANANPINSGSSGYATYTSMGFVSADASINSETPTQIQTGQGFFVVANSDVPGNLIFNNEMRTNGTTTFYKSANDTTEIHRYWLNLSNVTDVVGQTLIGYTTGATQNVDKGIDAVYFNDSPTALTSLINDSEFIIQGRALPFVNSDTVALGFKSNNAGNYSISLANFDGLFAENQAIYLKDNSVGILHDLKLADYSFSTLAGVFNNRFEIKYTNTTLETSNNELNNTSILIGTENQKITINSGKLLMQKVELIDLAGRVVFIEKDLNVTKTTIDAFQSTNQVLIVRVYTNDNKVVQQKLIF